MSQPLRIGVIGGQTCSARVAEVARRVGVGIAESGSILICGGLTGVMQAAAEGARDAGGLTVGLLPGEDPAAANPGIVIAIPTGLGDARNALIVRSADAVIAIDGRWGTLSEVAFCLKRGVPLIRLEFDALPEVPAAAAENAAEAVEWAIERARRRRPDA